MSSIPGTRILTLAEVEEQYPSNPAGKPLTDESAGEMIDRWWRHGREADHQLQMSRKAWWDEFIGDEEPEPCGRHPQGFTKTGNYDV